MRVGAWILLLGCVALQHSSYSEKVVAAQTCQRQESLVATLQRVSFLDPFAAQFALLDSCPTPFERSWIASPHSNCDDEEQLARLDLCVWSAEWQDSWFLRRLWRHLGSHEWLHQSFGCSTLAESGCCLGRSSRRPSPFSLPTTFSTSRRCRWTWSWRGPTTSSQRSRKCSWTRARERCQGWDQKPSPSRDTSRSCRAILGCPSSSQSCGAACTHDAQGSLSCRDSFESLSWSLEIGESRCVDPRSSSSAAGRHINGNEIQWQVHALCSESVDESPAGSCPVSSGQGYLACSMDQFCQHGYQPMGRFCCGLRKPGFGPPTAHYRFKGSDDPGPDRTGFPECPSLPSKRIDLDCRGNTPGREHAGRPGSSPFRGKLESNQARFDGNGNFFACNSTPRGSRGGGFGRRAIGEACEAKRSSRHSSWYRAAFHLARCVGLPTIAYLGQQDSSTWTGLGWFHSVCAEPDFLSPWQAAHDAFVDAFFCGFEGGLQHSDLCASVPSSLPRARTTSKHVAFSEDIDIYLESNFTFAYHLRLSVAQVQAWTMKPWSLHTVQGDPPHYLESPPFDADIPDDSLALMQQGAPNWNAAPLGSTPTRDEILRAIQTVGIEHCPPVLQPAMDLSGPPGLFQADALPPSLPSSFSVLPLALRLVRDFYQYTMDLLEPRPLRLQTWYVDHFRHPRCDQPRRVDLDPDPQRWLSQIRHLWQDRLLVATPVQLFVVRPHPPQEGERLEPVPHLIVQQQPVQGRVAILFTGTEHSRHASEFFSWALSVPTVVTKPELLAAANGDLHHFCYPMWDDRRCQLWRGSSILTAADPMRLHSGDCLFLVMLQIPRPEALPDGEGSESDDVWLGQHTVLLRPTPTSGVHHCRTFGEIEPPLRPGVSQVRIDGEHFDAPHLGAQPLWLQNLWPLFVAQARHYYRGGEPVAAVRTWFLDDLHVHEWHRWRELQLDPHCLEWEHALLQLWMDQLLPGQPFEIFLVTPEVPPIPGWESHLGDLILLQSPQPARRAILTLTLVRLPFDHRLRLVAYSVPQPQPRHELLRLVRLMFQCWQHPCTIKRGRRELLDGLLRHDQASGLHIMADLAPPEPDDILALMQFEPTGALQRGDLEDSTVAPSPLTTLASHETGAVLDVPLRPPESRPCLHCHGMPLWKQHLLDYLSGQGVIAIEEEGPVAFFHTWYIHHDDHRICFEPRPWMLTFDPTSWELQLRRLWYDHIDPADPLTFVVVHPRPPSDPRAGARGHLLLIQGNGDYAAFLITAKYQLPSGPPQLVQAAFSSFRHVDGDYLLRLIGAARPCQDVPCTLWYHPHRLARAQPTQLPDGASIEIDIPEDSDVTSLLAVYCPQPPGAQPLMEMPDIAEDSEDFVEDTEDSSSESSYEQLIWHLSAVYGLHHDEVCGDTDWSSYDDLLASTIELLAPDYLPLRAVHHVEATPFDLAADSAAAFITELDGDLAGGMVLVLVDVGFFGVRPDEVGDVNVREVRRFAPDLTRAGLLALLGITPYCEGLAFHRDNPACLVWRNNVLAPGQYPGPLGLSTGDYLKVAVPQSSSLSGSWTTRSAAGCCYYGHSLAALPDGCAFDDAQLNAFEAALPLPEPDHIPDDSSLMQLPGLVEISRPSRQIDPAWICDVFDSWTPTPHADSGPRVRTWFLDHTRFLRNDEAREVTLPLPFGQWLPALADLWADLTDLESAVKVDLLFPPPFAAPPDPPFYLVVTQRPRADLRSTVVAVVDDDVDPWMSTLFAIAVPSPLTRSALLGLTGHADLCPPVGPAVWCEVHHGDALWSVDFPRAVAYGDTFLIAIARCERLLPTDVPGRIHDDALQLLQVRLQKISRVLRPSSAAIDTHAVGFDPGSPSPEEDGSFGSSDTITLRMHSVVQVFEWIDGHFILPDFVLPTELPWPVECSAWLTLPLWDHTLPCDEFCVYHDGAFQADTHAAGFGVACFVRSGRDWYFGGAVAGPLWSADSYAAELYGSFVATKFAHDALKLIMLHQDWAPIVWMGFDSISVGQQAAGNWTCYKLPHLGTAIRSLRQLIELRFQVAIQDYHIPAHRGEPGNEMVDTLATAGAGSVLCTPLGGLLTHPFTAESLEALPWLWMLFDPHLRTQWNGQNLKFPRHPATSPKVEIFPAVDLEADSQPGLLDFVACSCNVLTLKPDSTDAGPLGLSRLGALLTQLTEVKCAFFGFQETRSRRSMACTQDDYILISSEASAQGHGGVLIGLSRRHPHGFLSTPSGSQQVCFTDESYSVIASTPRLLILRVHTAVLRAIVVNAHAPHSGASFEEIQDWWEKLYKMIPPKYATWPVLLLCDANARVGAHVSAVVGDHQAEPYNEKAIPFLDFLSQAQVFLPSTFVDFHEGTAGTWKHHSAGWRRNDFIGLPLEWEYTQVQSWVALDIDPSLQHEDHRAVCVHVRCAGNGRPQPHLHRLPKIAYEDLQALDWNVVHNSLPSWDMDVHSHYHEVQTTLISQATSRPKQRKPLKQTMTAPTWELVKLKRECRVALHETTRIQHRTFLLAFFSSWAGTVGAHSSVENDWISVVRAQDVLLAQLLFEFRKLGRLVTAALRCDDRAFFAYLSSRASDFLHPSDIRQFWQVIRSTLPKFKQRRTQHHPLKLEVLEDQWIPYFEQLELGTETSPQELVDLCDRFQTSHGSQFDAFEPGDLPTLFDLEREMRATRAHRATGFDRLPSQFYHLQAAGLAKTWYPLLLKQYLWQMEPLQSKGGQMTLIPKAGGTKAAGYRGIMLLENFGKRMHALVRKSLVSKLLPVKPSGQLGGFPRQQAPFGAQCLQTFGRLAANANFSSAVVFVDLANAFHRLIRELVSGATYSPDVDHILSNLVDGSARGVQAWLQLPALLTRLGVSDKITVLLQDIHMCTWMTIADTGRFCRTRRGSRPGSPLADVVFHVLMLDATYAIERWLADRADYQSCLRDLGINIGAVVWSDDLAVPFCCRTPHDLPAALEALMHCIMTTFHRRGFDLNIAKHKTSAVVSFRGVGASKLRTQYNLQAPAGMPISSLPTQAGFWLHFVPVYKHLGIMFSADGGRAQPSFGSSPRRLCYLTQEHFLQSHSAC